MSIRVVRLGTPRASNEGLRIGTVRRPPRGVPKRDYSRLNYYDVWLPDLAPSAGAIAEFQSGGETDAGWRRLARRYRSEMRLPHTARLLGLLAALSRTANLSVGCYCEDEARCHRSILRRLLHEHGAELA